MNSRWRCKSATQSTLPRVCHPLASSRFPPRFECVRCVSRGSKRGLPSFIRKVRPDVLPHYTCPQFPGIARRITLHAQRSSLPPTRHTRVRSKKGCFTFAIRARSVGPLRSSCLPRRRAMRQSSTRAVTPHTVLRRLPRRGPINLPPWMTLSVRVSRSPRPGQEYIGFLGTLEPRKNVPNLVRGWTQAVSDLQSTRTGSGRRQETGPRT